MHSLKKYLASLMFGICSGEWSGGRISWDRNLTFSWGWNYYHEIEIAIFHEIKITIMRSKVRLG